VFCSVPERLRADLKGYFFGFCSGLGVLQWFLGLLFLLLLPKVAAIHNSPQGEAWRQYFGHLYYCKFSPLCFV
jgi:hypothetical protein